MVQPSHSPLPRWQRTTPCHPSTAWRLRLPSQIQYLTLLASCLCAPADAQGRGIPGQGQGRARPPAQSPAPPRGNAPLAPPRLALCPALGRGLVTDLSPLLAHALLLALPPAATPAATALRAPERASTLLPLHKATPAAWGWLKGGSSVVTPAFP